MVYVAVLEVAVLLGQPVGHALQDVWQGALHGIAEISEPGRHVSVSVFVIGPFLLDWDAVGGAVVAHGRSAGQFLAGVSGGGGG